LLAALIRPIFNAESLAEARDRLSAAVVHLDGRLAKVATLLEDAEPDILAFYAFPAGHSHGVSIARSGYGLRRHAKP
jgi:hypothetical protein